MKGDKIILEEYHVAISSKIVDLIRRDILAKKGRYVITISGESGCGKTETGSALVDHLADHGIESVLICQDDFFVLPPKFNDQARRNDVSWLGPHVEVKMDLLNDLVAKAVNDVAVLICPLIDYNENVIGQQVVKLLDKKVVIIEGTYTALLKNVDTKVFIDKDRLDTLPHRQKRNRGNEVGDPFIENILEIEHKIIAAHRYIADVIIDKDNQLIRQI